MAQSKIFLIDDDELITIMLTRVLKEEGYEVRAASGADDVMGRIRAWAPDVVLLDITLPVRSGIEVLTDIMQQQLETQVVMLTADDSAETAVKAMKIGAVDYLTKPFNIDEVKIVIRNIIEKGRLRQEVVYLRKVHAELFDREILGGSRIVQELKKKIEKLADASVSTILITGESGTGKELFARYAHRLMHRDVGPGLAPFIRVNCAALPETLLESELFGHEKGSFTDAKTDKKGLFELAHNGTILLDEIGDMKQSLQGKLLRVLEERTIRPVGGSREIPVDVTVISTTNRNLADAVASGEFRTDLFFRLNTFYMHVPPLRERAEDIPVIARNFLQSLGKRYNKKTVKRFSPEAERSLASYGWPGNVRELKNLVERLVVLESEEEIMPGHLPEWLMRPRPTVAEASPERFALPACGVRIDDVERDLISQALARTSHNKAQAAKLLGISYDALRYQTKKFGLE